MSPVSFSDASDFFVICRCILGVSEDFWGMALKGLPQYFINVRSFGITLLPFKAEPPPVGRHRPPFLGYPTVWFYNPGAAVWSPTKKRYGAYLHRF